MVAVSSATVNEHALDFIAQLRIGLLARADVTPTLGVVAAERNAIKVER